MFLNKKIPSGIIPVENQCTFFAVAYFCASAEVYLKNNPLHFGFLKI